MGYSLKIVKILNKSWNKEYYYYWNNQIIVLIVKIFVL